MQNKTMLWFFMLKFVQKLYSLFDIELREVRLRSYAFKPLTNFERCWFYWKSLSVDWKIAGVDGSFYLLSCDYVNIEKIFLLERRLGTRL